MQIGKLRHRVTIQAQASPVPRNATGEPEPSYTDVDTVWAAIEPASGREFYAAEQVNAEVSHKVTIRYYDGLTTDHRLKFGTRIFDINVVRKISEVSARHELLCKELQ
jgi:SPP1 family predicted phage head-tail adaptor